MTFAALSFAEPWLLGFFAAVPLLWWLLRLTPPAAQKTIFPAVSLLLGLATPETTPARTPWWLVALRLVITTFIICAFAQPTLDPQPSPAGKGETLIVIDNDWAAARAWNLRKETMHRLVQQAEREHRAVLLMPTTPSANGDVLKLMGPMAPESAAGEIDRIEPEAWPADWQQANEILQKQDLALVGDTIWLSSGLGNVDAKILHDTLMRTGNLRVLSDTETPIYVAETPRNENDGLVVSLLRAQTDTTAAVSIAAVGDAGQTLGHVPLTFAIGSPHATAPMRLPLEVRNQITRLEIEGQRSAAATVLLDASWQRRPVGLIGDKQELDQHSLLNGLFYIDRALKPFADIHVDTLSALLKLNMTMLILTDSNPLTDEQITQLSAWVKQGGLLLRFAGDQLTATQNPREADLLPVALRTGDRAMGGTLSWATPQKLRSFPASSPFHSLSIPDDVTVSRQVLAEPSSELSQRTWAMLTDGTPLVTAKNLGQGLTILFHVPARSDWSNVPLSGLFVDMLRRMVDLAHGVSSVGTDVPTWEPLRALNAFGDEQKPAAAAQAIADIDFNSAHPGPQHPPGFYGTDAVNRAFNLGTALGQPEAWSGGDTENYQRARGDIALQPFLLIAAFLLLLGDFVVSVVLRGLVRLPHRKRLVSLSLLMLMCGMPASAAETDPVALTSKTWLAYVKTGNREIDQISEAGLKGLARTLQQRTSIDDIGVASVDPATDELSFFPFLYWPLVSSEAPLPPEGVTRVNDYLHHGGMIMFDSMNGETLSPVLTQHILAGIELAPMIRLPQDHVLKHSFYLLDDFPGRYAGNDFWLEPEAMSSYDGVATVLSGTNGWAAAWAIDANGKPLFPCTPNGDVQRERATRFGVNLVMYALTGNYKSDQLHAQALLGRMGK
jgi:hypothetical protein